MFETFKEIKHFLDNHSDEFVVVRLTGEGENLKGFCKNIVADNIVKIFGRNLVSGQDMDEWFDLSTVSIGQIQEAGKSVLVLVDKDFYKDFIVYQGEQQVTDKTLAKTFLRSQGIHSKSLFLRENLHHSDNAHELFKKINDSFETKDPKRLHMTPYVFSVQKKLRLEYLWKPPTICKLEENEFLKENKAMNHIIGAIVDKQDVNIGGCLRLVESEANSTSLF